MRELRSELEWIPLKAMRKEPQNRYQTAIHLEEDIKRYLAGQPLDATKHFIVIPDIIGFGQSSKPSDGLRARFPHHAASPL